MSIGQLLRWQWEGYPRYHQSRANLLIHIVAVPVFMLGTIALVAAVLQLSLVLLAVAIGCIVVAVALEGRLTDRADSGSSKPGRERNDCWLAVGIWRDAHHDLAGLPETIEPVALAT